MTKTELDNLDLLSEIADEPDTPLSSWEREFIASLRERVRLHRPLTEKQGEVFDGLVSRHLQDGEVVD